MKRWLRKQLRNLLNDDCEAVAIEPRYRQFYCRQEFKILDAVNGGHVVVMSDNQFPMDEPNAKIYIVAQDESIGDVITTMLVERKLSK